MSDKKEGLLLKLTQVIGGRLDGVDDLLGWARVFEPKMAVEKERLEHEVHRLRNENYNVFKGAVIKYSRHLTAMIEEYKKSIKTQGSKQRTKKAKKKPLEPTPEGGQVWQGAGTAEPEAQKEMFKDLGNGGKTQ